MWLTLVSTLGIVTSFRWLEFDKNHPHDLRRNSQKNFLNSKMKRSEDDFTKMISQTLQKSIKNGFGKSKQLVANYPFSSSSDPTRFKPHDLKNTLPTLRNSITNFPKNHSLGFLCVAISKTNLSLMLASSILDLISRVREDIWKENQFAFMRNLLLFDRRLKETVKSLGKPFVSRCSEESCLQSNRFVSLFSIRFDASAEKHSTEAAATSNNEHR